MYNLITLLNISPLFFELIQKSQKQIFIVDEKFQFIFSNDEFGLKFSSENDKYDLIRLVRQNAHKLNFDQNLQVELFIEEKDLNLKLSLHKNTETNNIFYIVEILLISDFQDLPRQKLLEIALDNTSDLVIVLTKEYKVKYANFAFRRVYQIITGNDYDGSNKSFEELAGDRFSYWKEIALESFHGRVSHEEVYKINGIEITLELSFNSVILEDKIWGLVVIGRDVSAKRQSDSKTKLMKALFDNLSDSILVATATGRFVYVNNQAAINFGRMTDDIINKNVWEIEPIFGDENEWNNHVARVKQHINYVVIREYSNKESLKVPYEVNVKCIKIGGDEYIIGISRSLTERHQYQRRLLALKEKYESILDSLPIAIYEKDYNGIYTFANKMLQQYANIPKDKFEGSNDFDLFEPSIASKFVKLDEELRNNYLMKRMQFDEKIQIDNKDLYLETHKMLIENPYLNEDFIIGYSFDVTQRVLFEKELELQKNLLRGVIDSLPHLVYVKNKQGRFILANVATAKLYDMTTQEFEMAYRIEAEEQFNYDSLDERERKVLEDGIEIDYEENFTKADGTQLLFYTSKKPFVWLNGETYILAISMDITTRKQLENEIIAAKNKAENANKAKSLFLGNISHEIRTPMNAIMGFSEILKGQITNRNHLYYLDNIYSAGNNLLILINDIIQLSSIDSGRYQTQDEFINFRNLCKEILNIYKLSAEKKGIELRLNIDENVPKNLMIDETSYRQILLNLIGNAIKYTDNGFVELIVQSKNNDISKKSIIKVQIKDSGIGIASEVLYKIFDEFSQIQTSNEPKKNVTGLGLTITKRLADILGIYLHFDSQVGVGTIVTIEFEVDYTDTVIIKESLSTETNDKQHNLFYFNNDTIMVVDDLKANIEIINSYLSNLNLNIINVMNATDAIDLVPVHKPKIILMDYLLPDMKGTEAIKRIRRIDGFKNVKTVAISAGHYFEEFNQPGVEFNAILSKPFNKIKLLNIISELLDDDSNAIISKAKPKPVTSFVLDDDFVRDISLAFKNIIAIQLLPALEKLSKSLEIDQVEIFIANLKEHSEKYKSDFFNSIANKLEEEVQRFDILEIENTIRNLIIHFKSAIGRK